RQGGNGKTGAQPEQGGPVFLPQSLQARGPRQDGGDLRVRLNQKADVLKDLKRRNPLDDPLLQLVDLVKHQQETKPVFVQFFQDEFDVLTEVQKRGRFADPVPESPRDAELSLTIKDRPVREDSRPVQLPNATGDLIGDETKDVSGRDTTRLRAEDI